VRVVATCAFLALFIRLAVLEVVYAPAARAVSSAMQVRTIYTTAPRGEILDRNGTVLVGNTVEPVLEALRGDLARNPREVEDLAVLLHRTARQVGSAVDNSQYAPYQPVPIATNPTSSALLYVQEHAAEFPGVTATMQTVPSYTPAGMAAANLLGYVGQITQGEYQQLKGQGYRSNSQVGQVGLEAEYQSALRGKPGVERIEVNSAGKQIGVLSDQPPVPGQNLKLSISAPVQEAAMSALAQEIHLKHHQVDPDGSGLYRATGGAVVVENPTTGHLLALASYPTYDPQWFSGGISQAHYATLTNPASHSPLEDRAISGQYFPGSTFKLVTATAGLTAGVVTANSYFNDQGGGLKIAGHFFHNDSNQSFGEVDLQKALTVSDDAYFYNIGATLFGSPARYGRNTFQHVAAQYGFTRPTGIGLGGESAGYVLTPSQKAALHRQHPKAYPYGNYYVGDAVESAIGQDDVAVTPLQLANAYAAFANGGTLWQPGVVDDTQTATGQVLQALQPHKLGATPPLTSQQRQAMIAGFAGVTTSPLGTAFGSFGPAYPIQVAGKTGTAQPVSGIPHTSPAYQQYTSVFTSFAPAQSPQYVVDCFIAQGGYGAAAAAPVVRQVYDVLFHQPILPTVLSGY
jgi:penicillin-binding protein 2